MSPQAKHFLAFFGVFLVIVIIVLGIYFLARDTRERADTVDIGAIQNVSTLD